MDLISKKLIQNTPILHFQGQLAEAGATLRATEVKPKLDRFIIANLGHPVPADWKIGKTNALKYKLKITTVCNSSEKTKGNLPMFFGKEKTALKINRPDNEAYDVSFDIFCLNESLRTHLEKLDWDSFFIATNVGTRQDKGYGSFFLSDSSLPTRLVGREIKIDKKITYRVDSYFQLNVDNDNASWLDVLKRINDVYKCMRSGINEGDVYFKSLMFAYAKTYNQWWDKRTIKEIKSSNKLDEDRKRHENRSEPDPLAIDPAVKKEDVYPMFRDNLGLATFESAWKNRYGFSIIKKDCSNNIKRFKSPILFKPLFIDNKWFVFLLHREIPNAFRNATFDVSGLKFKTFHAFTMKDYLNYIFSIDDYAIYLSQPVKHTGRTDNILNDLQQLKQNFITIK